MISYFVDMKLKRIEDIIGFRDGKMILIGIPLVGMTLTFLMFSEEIVENGLGSVISSCFLISIFYVSVFWFLYRGAFILTNSFYSKGLETTKRATVMIVFVLISYFIVSSILNLFIGTQYHEAIGVPHPAHYIEKVSGLVMSFLVLSIYEGFGLYHRLRKVELEKVQLERISITSQLESLKSQVNPHFLFNSLNTLSYLIPRSPERAENFVQQLSKVYRYVLEIKAERLIPLKDELTFLDSYLFLLKERFGENLKVSIDIDDSFLNMQIIPLSLQLLFENAIKHNVISETKPLHISVSVNNNSNLVVDNVLQKKKLVNKTTKMGLQNIMSRYKLLTDKLVEVVEAPSNFIVILPLLKAS